MSESAPPAAKPHGTTFDEAAAQHKNAETVRSLGADKVVGYTQEEFTKRGATYDVVLYAVAKARSGAARAP